MDANADDTVTGHGHQHTASRLASGSGSTLSPRVPYHRAGSFEPPPTSAIPLSPTPPPTQQQAPGSPRLRHIRVAGTASTSVPASSQHPSASTPNHSIDVLPHTAAASDPSSLWTARTPTLATQHLLDHPPRTRSPTKEKSSMDIDAANNDNVGLTLTPTHTTATGIPDRFHTQTPAFMSDGDASSHSGPSRTSTPFYGEWAATDGTDYESAYEGDAVIPMDSIRDAKPVAVPPPHINPNNKTGLYMFDASDDTRHSRGRRGPSASRRPKAAGQPSAGWSSWIRSLAFGNSPTHDRYQRLMTDESPKSPDFQQLYPYPRGGGVATRGSYPKFHTSMLSSPPQLAVWLARSAQAYLSRFHPLTLIAALLFVAGFVTSTTLLIIWILNPDKEPKPWRTFCAQSSPFPHDLADSLAPVDVFVGVMTMDSRSERRAVIRSTYGAHTRPIDPITGLETSNVQLKFIMGKPRKALERSVALEMELYNDIVVLDVHENMNGGKTHAFFKWAAANATVPILVPRDEDAVAGAPHGKAGGTGSDRVGGGLHLAQASSAKQLASDYVPGTVRGANGHLYDVAWKKADYVVKADDDAFLRLDELERHLRVSPRKMTYWGYLIRNWFMGGESYAVSADLVEYFATSPYVAAHVKGKEDKVTARWISNHPNASTVNYISEHCWIYDHPKSGTAYAHGFLFPDEVERIKQEEHRGLTAEEVRRRGGEHASKWYSTVSHWHEKYGVPARGLSIEEEMEALVEGGGVFGSTGFRSGGASWTSYESRVYEAEDGRLKELAQGAHHGLKQLPARLRADWNIDEWSHLPFYTRAVNGSGAVKRAADEEEEEEDDDEGSANKLFDSLPLVGAFKHLAGVGSGEDGEGHHASTTAGDERDNRKDANSTSTSARSSSASTWNDQAVVHHPARVPIPQNAAYLNSQFGAIGIADLHTARFASEERGGAGVKGSDSKVESQHEESSTDSTSTSGKATPPSTARRQHRGGTVVVHFLKRNEWFYETALALIGRDQMRAKAGRGLEWSMWGSPDAHAVHNGR